MRSAIILLLLPQVVGAQPLTPTWLADLGPVLNETSGLIHVESGIWTNLDSDNDHVLYRIEPATGATLQTVVLANATNVDWEDLATDGEWIYVGDFGNNAGNRTDLRIYRFPAAALTTTVESIEVDTIRFHYADQVDFTPAYDASNWDCEAFIARDDSLFLFTKNWLDERTYLYALSALPGDHSATRRDTLETEGLVTGATMHPTSGAFVLLGHSEVDYVPFLWTLRDFPAHRFFDGVLEHHLITEAPLQMEGITFDVDGALLLSNELSVLHAPSLWRVQLPMAVTEVQKALHVPRIFPMPCDDHVRVEGADPGAKARLFNTAGTLMDSPLVEQDGIIRLRPVPPGAYVLEVSMHTIPFRVHMIIDH